jgi:hypothetical protein
MRGGTVRNDAAPSACDVVGCRAPATDSYLHAGDRGLLEFSICSSHRVRVQKGEQPVVVTEPRGLSDVEGLLLILE